MNKTKEFYIVVFIFISKILFSQEIIYEDSTFYLSDKLNPIQNEISPLVFTEINTKIIFPLEAIKQNKYNGFVYCKFQVNKYGKIINIVPLKYSDKIFIKPTISYLNGITVDYKADQEKILYAIKLMFKVE